MSSHRPPQPIVKDYIFDELVYHDADSPDVVCHLCRRKLKNIKNTIKRHYIKQHGTEFRGKREQNEEEKVKKVDSPFADKEHFIRSCAQLQAEAGLSYDFWNMDVPRLLFSAFERTYDVSVKGEDMKQHLRSLCTSAIGDLKQKLMGKMCCLKLEAIPTVKLTLSDGLLGVSVQFMDDFEMRIAHLGMVNLNAIEPEFYAREVLDIAKGVGIAKEQIYSTTIDYASSLWLREPSDNSASSSSRVEEMDEDRRVLAAFGFWWPTLVSKLQGSDFGVEGLSKSPIQLIQLGINEWLSTYYADLKEIQWIHNRELFCDRVGDKSVKDAEIFLPNAALWSPKFTLLDELMRANPKMRLSSSLTADQLALAEKLWRALGLYQEMLTTGLKLKQYTCGDLVKDLLVNEYKLRQHNNDVSTALLDVMKGQKAKLLERIQFQAALYLDPRFNNCHSGMLTSEQRSNVVTYLMRVHERMREVEKGAKEDGMPVISNIKSEVVEFLPNIKMEVTEDDLNASKDEMFLKMLPRRSSTERQEELDLRSSLIALEKEPQPGTGFELAVFWKAKEFSDPEMGKLAKVVLAQPVSKIQLKSEFKLSAHLLTSDQEEDFKSLWSIYTGLTADM